MCILKDKNFFLNRTEHQPSSRPDIRLFFRRQALIGLPRLCDVTVDVSTGEKVRDEGEKDEVFIFNVRHEQEGRHQEGKCG